VEAQVEALLAAIVEGTPVNIHPCDISKEIQPSKLGTPCGFDGNSNKCLWHLPRRSLAHLMHLFNYCLRLGHLLEPLKEAKIMTAESCQKPKIPSKFMSDQPLFSYRHYTREEQSKNTLSEETY
jgi:hypothetical protein